jgi:pimeloyl-ACP methyl ester carboxylesterase
MKPDLRANPDALRDSAQPRIERLSVNGTSLYAEVRGSGQTVLLIHGGGEDAEMWRPIAERLTGFTVVTYDRRGTLRSGRDDWPGGGSAQHADDAAGLVDALNLDDVIVFGGSSGAIVALRLALRHPERIRQALIYEPGYFRHVPGGDAFQRPANAAAAEYLETHPDDWLGALAAFLNAVPRTTNARPRGFLTPPPGKEWYGKREDANAEAFVRDDVQILTREVVDEAELAASAVDIRFAYGTATLPIFRDIATHLADVRGADPDVIDGVGHVIYYHPDDAATFIRGQLRER